MTRLRNTWDWLTGLRISTRRERDAMAQIIRNETAQRKAATSRMREAQRLLTILSEPLKDWDLADFPGLLAANDETARHMAAIQEAYRVTAPAVAPMRAGIVLNDKARGRGWDDRRVPTQRPSQAIRRPLP